MADLQRQIGENAQVRASAEASTRSQVGDVIQPGQPIPDDVTGFDDGSDGNSLWERVGVSFWRCPGTKLTEEPGEWVSEVYGPLTVTAVREQPDEPKSTPCPNRQPHEAHEHSGMARPDGVPPAQCLGVPEPQQADASPVLDLVRRFGIERYSLGYNVGQGDTAAATRDEAKASALYQRIVAVAPPYVQARDTEGEPLWIFGCGHVEASPRPPTFDHCTRSDAAPWLPLLVGGDPAPESGILAHARKALHERDKAIAQLNQMQENAEAWQRERDETIRRVNHLTVELAATQQMLDVMTAQPDPLVLSLPEVPEGAVALVGPRGMEYTSYEVAKAHGGGRRWECGSWHGGLGSVLDIEGSVRVELAPPREPRTDLPCGHLIESSRFEDDDGAKVLITVPPAHDSNGDVFTTPLVWCAQGHGWVSLTAEEFAEVTE